MVLKMALNDVNVKMTLDNGCSETEMGWAESAKLKYFDVDLGTSCSTVTCVISTDVDFTANLVRLGTNYRF